MAKDIILGPGELKRIPQFMVLTIILLSGLPVVLINYFDMEFGFTNLFKQNIQKLAFEYKMQAYLWKIILQWTSFVLASLTALLAFTQYRLTKDTLSLVIGVAIICAGFMELLQIIFVGGLTQTLAENPNTYAFFWVLNSALTELLLLIGLLIALHFKLNKVSNLNLVLLVSLIFVSLFSITIMLVLNYDIPRMWYANHLFIRPYEFVPLALSFLLVTALYPLVYKKYPTMLANGIFYMGTMQILISLHLLLLSKEQYDGAFYVAYFLKIVFYFIPFSCLMLNYIFSYRLVLKMKHQLKKSNDRLQYLATHDYLTKLYNRRYFEENLTKVINDSTTAHSFALFIIDIDKFKYINDSFGHFHGDVVLKKIAAKLKTIVRSDDLLFRIGGDEFALIMLNVESNEEVFKLADRIVNNLNLLFTMKDKMFTTTVSVGVSIFPQDEIIAENLFQLTDHALYDVKKSGRNNFKLYSKHHATVKNRNEMITEQLHLALKRDEFYLLFQPKYHLITKKITGVEALLRWNNQKLGAVFPEEFIPIAESTSLIIPIGRWILEQSCERINKLCDCSVPLAINISPVQLMRDSSFFSNFNNILLQYNIQPKHLEIEITESFFMQSNEKILNVVNSINKLGVCISVDDFGMGYSSLSRLKILPIANIKIDKFFIADLVNNECETAIVDIIIALANQLDIGVIAEGIETKKQLDYLITKGCYIGQGFYFSRPVDFDTFKAMLLNQKDNL